jgi:hypothetical protein
VQDGRAAMRVIAVSAPTLPWLGPVPRDPLFDLRMDVIDDGRASCCEICIETWEYVVGVVE